MDAKKCDRCGAFYDVEYERLNGGAFFNQVHKINPYATLQSSTRAKFDLCNDCRKAFEEFMKGGKR